jgi:small-conductance mechanosensitive channel
MRCCHSACMPPWQILQRKRAVPDLVALLTKFFYEISGVLLVLLVALALSHAFKRLINVLRDLKHLSPTLAVRVHSVRRWVITLLAILVILEALGIFHGAWALISTMLAALAIGFVAAWSVLSNATAAMLLLIFRPFRVGDHVEVLEFSNGYPIGGEVLDMNLMYTTLRPIGPHTPLGGTPVEQPEGDPPLVRVPNNLFFQRPLRTQSRHASDSKLPFFSRPKG